MAIKFADTAVPMSDFPVAMAEHIEFDDGKSLQEKYDLGELGGEGGGGHIELTQAEYDALSDEEKNNGAIYFITDAEGSGGTGVVDDKMDTSSINPVQNKVLAQEIARAENGKQYLKITGPMPGDIGYLYVRTIYDAIENGSALNVQGVDIETVETNMQDNFYDILYRYANAGEKKYTATEGLSLNIVPQDTCIIFEAEDVPSGIDKYEVILEWFEPPFVTIYSSAKEFDPIAGAEETDYNFYDLTDLEDSLTSIFNDMKIKSEFNIKNHNFSFDLNKDGDRETLTVNSYKLQKDFAGNGILTVELEDGRILTSTRPNGRYSSWSNWNIKEPEKIPKVYTSLAELGLDTTATINDIIGAMEDSSQFTYKTDVFDYATEYNNIQYGTVTIHKQSGSRIQVLMTDKDTGNLYIGKMDNANKVVGWRKDSFHRAVAQATAGYFKFKPSSDGGNEQPLRATATDNYGGMIEISGNAPSQDQYKPFKCVRLSNGTYASYDAANTTNNKMKKLYLYDGYMYLQVETYTTVTFTGLIEAPTFVETLEDTSTEIPIVSLVNPSIKAAAGSNINTVGTPSVTASESNGTTTFTFNNLKGATGGKGDTGTRGSQWFRGTGITGTNTTATIFSGSGVSSALVNDMYLNTSTSYVYQCTVAGNASAAKWVYIGTLKGAKGDPGVTGTTPTIKASAGSNIGSVGTPSVSASTSGTTTTFTFNYLKGAKGDKGDKGDPGVSKSTNGPNYTICTVPAGKVAILFGVKDGGGYIKVSSPDVVYINGTKITSSNQSSTAIDVGKVYVVENVGSSAVTLSTYSAGGGQFVVLGPI